MPKVTNNALDLYSKVEDLLGVKEASPKLYAHYLLFLTGVEFETLLDVGCGSGDFLLQMRDALSIEHVKGIDLSSMMVEKTKDKLIPSECIELCSEGKNYDIITSVFDMLNYLDGESLKEFLKCVYSHLNEGGYFLCDINTLYGFENVAVGSYIVDDKERFLAVDSDFEYGVYSAFFTLFEKSKNSNNFVKSQEHIYQYMHEVDDIVKWSGLELVSNDSVSLYDFDEPDKKFLVLKKF